MIPFPDLFCQSTLRHRTKLADHLPLGEEADSSNYTNALSVSWCLEKIEPASAVCLLVHLDGGNNFIVLKLHKLVFTVASDRVIFGDDRQGFLGAIFADQPSRRFGCEENGNGDDDREYALKQRGQTPRPVTGDLQCRVRHPA